MSAPVSLASRVSHNFYTQPKSYLLITVMVLNLFVAGGLTLGGIYPYSYLGPIGGGALIAVGAVLMTGEACYLVKAIPKNGSSKQEANRKNESSPVSTPMDKVTYSTAFSLKDQLPQNGYIVYQMNITESGSVERLGLIFRNDKNEIQYIDEINNSPKEIEAITGNMAHIQYIPCTDRQLIKATDLQNR